MDKVSWIQNTAAKLAQAAGTPVPKVEVLHDPTDVVDMDIDTFADPPLIRVSRDAFRGSRRNLLFSLAHEIGHLRDTRGQILHRVLYTVRHALWVLLILVMHWLAWYTLIWTGTMIHGEILQLSIEWVIVLPERFVSRQNEYRADCTAVRLTKDPAIFVNWLRPSISEEDQQGFSEALLRSHPTSRQRIANIQMMGRFTRSDRIPWALS